MWIKDLEILSGDLADFKIPEKKEGDLELLNLNKVPQKPTDLFEEPYKDYFMVANFPASGWIVLLNQKAKKILDLVDNKRIGHEIYQAFLASEAGEKEKFGLKDVLCLLSGETALKDAFTKFILNRSLLNPADFLNFLRLLVKTRLINFSGGENKACLPTKKLCVWFHLTSQCNFSCHYCYVLKTPQRMGEGKALAIIDKIFESAQKNDIKRISINFAGGEPLLEFPVMKKIINHIHENYGDVISGNIKLALSIVTNASLINQEMIEFVRKNKIQVGVSLDSLRKLGEGKKSLEGNRGIELLLKEKMPFSVLTVVSRFNLAELPALADWLFKNRISFKFNFIRKNPLIEWDLIPKNDELVEIISEIYKKALKNVRHLPASYAINNNVPHRYSCFSDVGCGVGQTYAAIAENGDIYPCHMTFSQKDMKLASAISGSDVDIYSLINSPKVKALNPGTEKKVGCKDCQWRYICSSPCPMLNLFGSGDVAAPAYYCSAYKVLIPKVLKLEAERLLRIKK